MSARARHPPALAWSVALFAAYVALGWAGLQLLDPFNGAAVIWPAAGLAVGALVVSPRSAWPALAVAVLLANFVAQIAVRKSSLALSTEIAVVGVVQTLVAALIMGAIAEGPRPRIGSLRTVAALFVAAGIASTLAATGAAAGLSIDLGRAYGPSLVGWGLGNAIGMLVVVPLILALAHHEEDGPASRAEAYGLIALTGAVAAFVFVREPDSGLAVLSVGDLVVPFLLWCAIRAGARAATLGSLLLAAVSAICTMNDRGPFADLQYGAHGHAQLLQGFLATIVLTTLVVGAVVADHRRARAQVHRAQADLRTVFAHAPIGHAILDAHGALTETNAALTAITGYSGDELTALGCALARPGDREALACILAAKGGGSECPTEAEGEITIVHRDGHLVDVALYVAVLDGGAGGAPDRTLLQVIDVSARKQLESQLRELADHDPLTGLLNRRSFDRELAAHLERARRYGAEGAVLVVDLDQFKTINDTQGHHVGDELLVSVGALLRRRLRATDVVARLGGDEFAVLLLRADRAAAVVAARELVVAVRTELGVTISLGVAMVDATRTAGQLLVAADEAMYTVKAAGRDGHALPAPA
ncbi:MAG TPA: diguanylate cyclase [Baekduia sp.]|jgi:diguanylate cyclase (GGDEF)-like protein/PAS domain S-box-containing protein